MDSIPYDKRSGKIWFNGKTVNWADANIHILNHGLHYASCVFEGERVYDGEIFKLEEHTSRLFHSAKRMGMVMPYSEKEINKSCKEIVGAQKINNGYVRPIVWRGSEMMAISAQKNKVHVAIASWEWGSYFDPKLKLKGIKLNLHGRPFTSLSNARAWLVVSLKPFSITYSNVIRRAFLAPG
mgnify:CR=1 FL=1